MSKWLLAPLLLLGCREASSAERTSRATLSGRAQYRDADTDRENAHRDPNTPAGQTGTVRVVLHGNGAIDADCADAGNGQFVAYYDGNFTVDRDGTFSAPLYPAAPPLYTPSGCQVRGVDGAQVANVEISAELAASVDGCRDLCDGRARQASRDRCQNASDPAGCRVPIGTALAQTCAQTCLSSAAGIVGRGWLDGSTIATSDGGDLMTGNLGDLHAQLQFEQMVDANRQVVGE